MSWIPQEFLTAEVHWSDLLEYLIFALIYWGLPMLRRRRAEAEAEKMEPIPVESVEPETAAPTPVEPVTDREPEEEEPEPMFVDPMGLLLPDPAEQLRESLDRWALLAPERVGTIAAARVRDMVLNSFPPMDKRAQWTNDAIRNGQVVAMALDGLLPMIEAPREPAAMLMHRACRELTGGAASPLIPLRGPISDLAERLLRGGGLAPYRTSPGRASAQRRLATLEGAVVSVMLTREMESAAALDEVINALMDLQARGTDAAVVVTTLFEMPAVVEAVMDGMGRALVTESTGPLAQLHLSPEDERGWIWRETLSSMVTLNLARLRPRAPQVEGLDPEAAMPRDAVGEALVQAVVEFELADKLGMPRWDSRSEAQVEQVSAWLETGAIGHPGGKGFTALEAVTAWRIAERTAGTIEQALLGRLLDLIEGRLVREPVVVPERISEIPPAMGPGHGRGQRARLHDALALELILGPPAARRHPAMGRGPQAFWRRRRL